MGGLAGVDKGRIPPPRDALEEKGPQRRPQQRLGRPLEEVAKAVGGGYCRGQMPLKLALAVRGTVAGHRLGALEGGGRGGYLPPFQCIPSPGLPALLTNVLGRAARIERVRVCVSHMTPFS